MTQEVVYVPSKPALTAQDFPESIRPHAVRKSLAGCGTEAAPRVWGWVVYSHGGPNGGVAGDDGAKAWLKANGFKHGGRKWNLRDDIAAGEYAFTSIK